MTCGCPQRRDQLVDLRIDLLFYLLRALLCELLGNVLDLELLQVVHDLAVKLEEQLSLQEHIVQLPLESSLDDFLQLIFGDVLEVYVFISIYLGLLVLNLIEFGDQCLLEFDQLRDPSLPSHSVEFELDPPLHPLEVILVVSDW